MKFLNGFLKIHIFWCYLLWGGSQAVLRAISGDYQKLSGLDGVVLGSTICCCLVNDTGAAIVRMGKEVTGHTLGPIACKAPLSYSSDPYMYVYK